MTKDVAIKSDLDIQVQQYVSEIETFRSNLKDWGIDHLADIQKHQIQLEALDKAASQSKLGEIQKEVAIAKIEIARWFGARFKASELTADDMGMDRKTTQRYRNLADTPKAVYQYAMKSAVIPSVNKVLSERERYLALKNIAKEVGMKQAELKRMFSEGYSVLQAERELNGEDGDVDLGLDMDEDDMDMDISFDMGLFDDSVSTLEGMVEELHVVMKEEVEITPEVYKIGITILRRLRASTKQMSTMFMEIKKELG